DRFGKDWTSALATIADSSSTVKGHIRLANATDQSKFLLFTLSALASPSGYKNLTVSKIAESTANPFSNGDNIILAFNRTGDIGTTGSTGATGIKLIPTASKTSDYTAAVNDLVVCDISSGSFTVTCPASPAVGDRFGVLIASNDSAGRRNL